MNIISNRLTFFISAALVFIYLILRACYVPIMHDEAATFFHYVIQGEFIPGLAHWDANNHLINSALSIGSVRLLGNNLFALRLPNLLFFIVYAYFLLKLSELLEHKLLRVSFWALGLCMHGFIEFFTLSRGYGISMALLMGAFYFGLIFFRQYKLKHLSYSLMFFWFAILGNLTLLNIALIFCFLVGLQQVLNFRKSLFKMKISLLLGMFMVFSIPLVMLSFKLKSLNLLYYGEGESFWEVSISSFSRMYFGSINPLADSIWVCWFIISILLLSVFVYRFKTQTSNEFATILLPGLLFLNVAGLFMMKWLLNINYPSDRTGMHLILLLWLSMLFILDKLHARFHYLAYAFSIFFLVHFVFHMNLGYTTLWKDEGISKEFWNKVHDQTSDTNGIKDPTIGGYHMQSLQWAWYNYQEKDKLQNLQFADYYSNYEDFIMYVRGDFDLNRNLYDSVYTDRWSNITLAKRKSIHRTVDVYQRTDINSPSTCNDEFFGFYETSRADTLGGQCFLIETQFNLQTLRKAPRLHLVCSLSDSAGGNILYKNSPLEWLQAAFLSPYGTTSVKIWIPHDAKDAKKMLVYLWNVDKIPFQLKRGSIKIRVSDRL